MSGMPLLTNPLFNPERPSNLTIRYPLPTSSVQYHMMDSQQDFYFQQGTPKPTRFQNDRYANPRTRPRSFPLTFANDSSGQSSSSPSRSGMSLPPFRLAQVD